MKFVINQVERVVFHSVTIIGKINAISTSKIRKIIAIKKKCKEKGSREEDLGSKPHSKGEHFSRSRTIFFDRTVANKIIIRAIVNKISLIYNINIIIYTIRQ